MGLFGYRKPIGPSAAQQVAAGGDGMSSPPPSDPHNRLFGDGSIGGIAGGIGKLLMYGPFAGVAQDGMNQRRQMLNSEMGYKSLMAQTAQYKATHPDPTGTMQNAQATGAMPGTPEYQALIRQSMLAPHYITLGNPENGQTVIDANNPPPQQDAGPPPEAVAHLKGNPALAAQFDEVFGPGSAARAMGSQ